MSEILLRTVQSLDQVNPIVWDGLDHGLSPFQRYGFLKALENSASVGPGTGWRPHYLLAEAGGVLVGACAAYVKSDSYGEYIFDWAWARAAGHFGIDYYPKLVVAAPFTPASGNRLLIAPKVDAAPVQKALGQGLFALVESEGLSGGHILFCSDAEAEQLEAQGMARRSSLQFHWRNRDYHDFNDFLSGLKSRKRKQIRKERRKAQESVDSIDWVKARDMGERDFAALDCFYRKTVHEHRGFDYLQPGFFEAAATLLPDTMLFARAKREGEIVAGALFFESDKALYGRYWGTAEKLEFLHFELAYYAGIERCIKKGLSLFEAGAQGEHKLLRGFEPTMTHSCHWMADAKFDKGIRGFILQEAMEVKHHVQQLESYGPYKKTEKDSGLKGG